MPHRVAEIDINHDENSHAYNASYYGVHRILSAIENETKYETEWASTSDGEVVRIVDPQYDGGDE